MFKLCSKNTKGKNTISVFTVVITTVLAVGVAIGLGVGLGFSLYHNISNGNNQSNTTGSSDVCTSQTCIKLASQIISYMDESVYPCQDFYQFACNGYLGEAIIPNGKFKC